jgi:hypothetical protein
MELMSSLSFSSCVTEALGRFGNQEEGKRPPLEAVTKEQVKKQEDWEDSVRAVVNRSDNSTVNCN